MGVPELVSAERTILCFGDSNTWGFDPKTAQRFPRTTRWPGVLQRELVDQYRVIEEGLNGRTTVWDDPNTPGRNGGHYLVPCLQSHRPLDHIILFLGLNDLKKCYSVSADQIVDGVRTLIGIIARSAAGANAGTPGIMLLAPPPLGRLSLFAEMFESGGPKSLQLAPKLLELAAQCNCGFFDTTEVVAFSDVDGIHFDAHGHEALGIAVAKRIRLFGA